jgi:alpha-L-fucosidase 2
MADLTSPLMDLIDRIQTQGSRVAKDMYNSTGFVCHHNTDLWGDCAPQDDWISSTFWPTGAAWLVTHIMEQYRFTGDKAFLKSKAGQLQGAAQFFVDTLVDYNGWKVVSPSLSPENEYILPGSNNNAQALTFGTTMDNSILWELFSIVEEVQAEVGGIDPAFADKVRALRAKLPPLQVSPSTKGIQEWIHGYAEVRCVFGRLCMPWGGSAPSRTADNPVGTN